MRTRSVIAALLVLFSVSTYAAEDTARDWIERMNVALKTRNYQGVLVHQSGQYREVLRITHRVQADRMKELVTMVTPIPGREFVRDGNEWMAYYPEHHTVLVQTRNRSYGFLTALRGFSPLTRRFYLVSDGGSVALDGSTARQITLEPRDALRYGYRFWLDEKTALPLKTQLVSSSGEILDEISFLGPPSLPETISDEQLRPKVDAASFKWLKTEDPAAAAQITAVFRPRNELMPAGFRVILSSGAGSDVRKGAPPTRFIVSDTIGWVSVVVEQVGRNPKLNDVMGPRDKQRVARNSRPDGVWVMGSTSTYVAKVDDFTITVVGEVPPATVKAIAEAVKPE